jgi:hypothetical protein
MSRAQFASRAFSLAAATTVFAIGLAAAPVGNAAAECPTGWEFGPTLRLLQSDGWSVTVGASGRAVGGSAVAVPPDRGALWRGTGEGGSDGATVSFGIGWDNGKETHYTGVIDPSTGSVSGERPDGVTWKTTVNLRCNGASNTAAPPDAPPTPDAQPAPEAPATG